jgi:hypothetical protein
MASKEEMKYCVDCKHYRPHVNDKAYCQSPNLDYVDLVTGLTKKHLMECKDLRGYICDELAENCGADGRWFEADVC